MEKNLEEITKDEFDLQMDILYDNLSIKKQNDLLVELECLGNCEQSRYMEVKYYYDKKDKEYTYRVDSIP